MTGSADRRRRRLLIAAVLTLGVALFGELVELPPLVHLVCLVGTVVALAAVAYVAPALAAGDPPAETGAPHPGPDRGPGV